VVCFIKKGKRTIAIASDLSKRKEFWGRKFRGIKHYVSTVSQDDEKIGQRLHQNPKIEDQKVRLAQNVCMAALAAQVF
jgi:hypothetical protein